MSPPIIKNVELDFLTLIEYNVRPPIAFRTKQDLQNWARSVNLNEKNIDRFSSKNIIEMSGQIPVSQGALLPYMQVWARAEYRGYRAAMIKFIRRVDRFTGDFHPYDVDHAVARSRLKECWPSAWINIMLVERGLNRSVGALFKNYIAPPLQEATVLVDLECILKIFYGRKHALSKEGVPGFLKDAYHRFLKDSDAGKILTQIAMEQGIFVGE